MGNKYTVEIKEIDQEISKNNPEMCPSLIVNVKPSNRVGYFDVSLIHPNERRVMFEQTIKSASYQEAFECGKKIKERDFSNERTFVENVKYIPKPKRGKMRMITKTRNDYRPK